MRRETKVTKGIALTEKQVIELPAQIRGAKAVLLHKAKSNNALIYVLDTDEIANAVVYVNYNEKGEVTNSLRSAGLTDINKLRNKGNYILLKGKL